METDRQEVILMQLELNIYQDGRDTPVKFFFTDIKRLAEVFDLFLEAAPEGTTIQMYAGSKRNREGES